MPVLWNATIGLLHSHTHDTCQTKQGVRSGSDGAIGDEVARLAALLLQQPHACDRHAAVHRLAHVVDRQQCDLHSRQRFHLHAGRPDCFSGRLAMDAGGVRIDGEKVDSNMALLDDLCNTMLAGSLCALGGMVPFPVMSAIKHFPEDFTDRKSQLAHSA